METNSLEYDRSYVLKFYLNARHFLTDGSYVGETHPHTWEFTLTIRVSGLRFVRFNVFEEGIDACLAPYRNKVLNEEPPFDVVSPTLENLVEEFAKRGVKPSECPAVLIHRHGPFTWGKNAFAAVDNALILEEVAKMAYRTESVASLSDSSDIGIEEYLLDKHYQRKHGKNAYYGQR